MAASYAHMAALWRVKERTQICSLFFLQNTFPFLNAFSLYRQKFEFGNMLIVAGFNTRIKHHHFSPFIHGICELSAHFIRADRRLDRRPCHNQLLSNLKQLPPLPLPSRGRFTHYAETRPDVPIRLHLRRSFSFSFIVHWQGHLNDIHICKYMFPKFITFEMYEIPLSSDELRSCILNLFYYILVWSSGQGCS